MVDKTNKTSLVKNWAYLFVSDVSQSVISFFVFMLLARKLTPEGYGTLNTILALAALFSVFSINFSANQVVIREVTLHPLATKRIVNKVVVIRMITLILSITGLIIYQFYAGETHTLFLVSTSLIVISTLVWDLAESIAFGHFVTKFTTYISMIAGFSWFIVIFLLPAKSVSVELVLLIYAMIHLIRSISYMGFSFKKYVIHNNENLKINYWYILAMSMPYLWIRIMGAFGDQVPILLLRGNSGTVEVGYYALGNRFVMPITVAVSTGLRAMFPFMTKMFDEDQESFNQKLASGFSFVLIVGSSIAMILTISSYLWIPFFFGEVYMKSIQPFNYQSWLGVLLCFDMILANVLSATYRQKTLAIIMSIDILIVFPFMYLGSKYGANMMALAKLSASFITIIYHVIVVMVILKADLKSWSFLLSCLYFALMMVITTFISDIWIKIILISILLAGFLVIKKSPLRQMGMLIYNRLKTTQKEI